MHIADPAGQPLPDERRRRLLERLTNEGRIVASALAREWSVSEDTVRRDIKELADAGLLDRVHGGALPNGSQPVAYEARTHFNAEQKLVIARRAAPLVTSGALVLLYGGTTVLELARALPEALHATIVTNDPRIALEAARRPGVETIVLGGRMLREPQLIGGTAAVDAIRSLRADMCFLGSCALHDAFGLGVSDFEEAALCRAFIDAAANVIALVTADKLQTAAPFHVAPAAALTGLVAGPGAPQDVLDRYRALGTTVMTTNA